MIRGCPSTSWVSFLNACMLSLVFACASIASALRRRSGGAAPRSLARNSSASRRAYQTCWFGIVAKRPHALAVGAHGTDDDRPDLLRLERLAARGDLHAGGQPLDVPFERAGQGLVEVVQVEHQVPFRGRVEAEVAQVRVTAQLHAQARIGGRGEVSGHHQGRTPVEGERGRDHAAVSDRQQLGYPRRTLATQQLDRIGPQRASGGIWRDPPAVRSHVPSCRPPLAPPRLRCAAPSPCADAPARSVPRC